MANLAILSSRYKSAIHILYLLLVVAAIGLSVPRLFMKPRPRTRANTIALGIGAKSLVIVAYQLLTEHVRYFERWASPKANTILNSLEIIFWAAVAFLLIQANIKSCHGVACGLSWSVVALSVFLSIMASYLALVSYIEFRDSRRRRTLQGHELSFRAKDMSPSSDKTKERL